MMADSAVSRRPRQLPGHLQNSTAPIGLGEEHSVAPTILAESTAMRRVMERLAVVAPSDAPVLLLGETGTGKELLAHRIHVQSRRAHGPMIAVNCAAIPESLIEAELFGHERGAFTGADRPRVGRFVAANGGTLFLDEIGELPMSVQAKLLRVLQEERVEPLGSNRSVPIQTRMIYATHRDLHHLVDIGAFREDLYYRVHVIEMVVPALRDRLADLDLLIDQFLRENAVDGHIPLISAEARRQLHAYAWPGNVRELKHTVLHGAVMSGGHTIRPEHLPAEFLVATRRGAPGHALPTNTSSLAEVLAGAERQHIEVVLNACKGNRVRTAEVLQISRKTLWEKIRTYGIEIQMDGRQRA